ncbi:thioredoxin-disulfide reductase [Halobacteriales archaeon SW_7_68_16]|nr:MAG: thioredoxin-disulfide reductase [Halobacteriales archaeon SW_7_68_16]
MTDVTEAYEVIVVGGGPAGMTTALYTTRLGHRTALIDRGGGRAAMMLDTHNVIGVPESTSGNEFLATAGEQLAEYGTDVHRDFVTAVERDGEGFRVETDDATYLAERIVLSTGFSDEKPEPPLPRTGRGLHYCLHCDAYMFVDESVYVMGHGDSAAYVAMIMLNFTDDVDLLLNGDEPTWSDGTDELLRAHPVEVIEAEVTAKFADEDDPDWLGGFEFADGRTREYRVDGVYAVGDLTPGHNQIPVAMGEGAKAGIAIHKGLRTYPKARDELDGGIETDDVPAIDEDLRTVAAGHAGDD